VARGKLGRTPQYGEPLSERVQVLFTVSHIKQLEKRFPGADLSVALRELALGEAAEKPEEKAAAGLLLDLSEEDQAALAEIGRKIGHRKLSGFIENLATAALEHSEEEVDDFIKGWRKQMRAEAEARQRDVLATIPTAAETTAPNALAALDSQLNSEERLNQTRENVRAYNENLKKGGARKKAS
jgi:hypothetical protein